MLLFTARDVARAAERLRAPSVAPLVAAAREAVDVLAASGVHACVTGSLAAWAWGNGRPPRDADVEVPRHAVEAILARAVGGIAGDREVSVAGSGGEVFARVGAAAGLTAWAALRVDPVMPSRPCSPMAWAFVDGLPLVPPAYLVARKLLRAAAGAQGTHDSRAPSYDLDDAAAVLAAHPACDPWPPPELDEARAALAAHARGCAGGMIAARRALRFIPAHVIARHMERSPPPL